MIQTVRIRQQSLRPSNLGIHEQRFGGSRLPLCAVAATKSSSSRRGSPLIHQLKPRSNYNCPLQIQGKPLFPSPVVKDMDAIDGSARSRHLYPIEHPTEPQVRAAIVGKLEEHNNQGGPYQLALTGGNETAPTYRVRYVWKKGKRIRVHTYALDVKEGTGSWAPWTLDHVSGVHPNEVQVTVLFCAELSWGMVPAVEGIGLGDD